MTRPTLAPITITGTAQKQAWSDRVTPAVEEVRPGLWSIPIDFGDSPIRYTFCYLVSNDRGETVVIDPGGDTDAGRAQFDAGLKAAGVSWDSIIGVVSTHLHPDHLGMVSHVADTSGGWIAMHRDDADVLSRFEDTDLALAGDRQWLFELGVPDDQISGMAFTLETVAASNALARPSRYLLDGDLLPLKDRSLRIVATPGHTPGHICIVDEDHRVVFTGDHILPRITPNVGLAPARDRRNALSQYYSSLDLMSQWADHEALPAHEYRFLGLADRAAALAAHHDDRAAEILDALVDGVASSVWELGPLVSWSRGWESLDGVNLRAALSELQSHVYYLVAEGELEKIAAAEGPVRFRRHN